ncbi:hypothetical protein L3i20_v233730 [Paenibacillus sp. L3-i20]|nr:hypothetical protein L3i20_v233730 [Paenibacillus sp. L3-i20]
MHFDVNNVNATYPTDSQTINPMQFYPSISGFSLKDSVSTQSHEDHDHKPHSSLEYFYVYNTKDGYLLQRKISLFYTYAEIAFSLINSYQYL